MILIQTLPTGYEIILAIIDPTKLPIAIIIYIKKIYIRIYDKENIINSSAFINQIIKLFVN